MPKHTPPAPVAADSDTEVPDDAAIALLNAKVASKAIALATAAKKRRALLDAAYAHPEIAAHSHGRGAQALLAFLDNSSAAQSRRLKESDAEKAFRSPHSSARKRLDETRLASILSDPAHAPPPLGSFVERLAGSPVPLSPAFSRIALDAPVAQGLRQLGDAVSSLKSKASAEGSRLVVERGARPEDRLREKSVGAPGAGSPRVSFYKRAGQQIAAETARREAEAAAAAAAKPGGSPPPIREPWRPASRSPSPSPSASGPPSRAQTPAGTARASARARPATVGSEGAAAAAADTAADGAPGSGEGQQRPLTSDGAPAAPAVASSPGGSARAQPRYWPSDAPLESAFPSPPRDKEFDAEFTALLKDHVAARNSFKEQVLRQDYSPQKLVEGYVE
jgi:hypothetical protein